eukprot:TRINITY_DN4272_c0_g1_i5.p1 TRINITY_DN4272_c0_g1~~TRINITY_DN4272_c0_g1_i5.p1  ORF type:complete len:1057 (+),score=211.46 TRINITY_DN4272_c0_g1_i5:105-3275(+)
MHIQPPHTTYYSSHPSHNSFIVFTCPFSMQASKYSQYLIFSPSSTASSSSPSPSPSPLSSVSTSTVPPISSRDPIPAPSILSRASSTNDIPHNDDDGKGKTIISRASPLSSSSPLSLSAPAATPPRSVLRVVIVGGGPTGLLLASLLVKLGKQIQVRVYEDRWYYDGATGTHLWKGEAQGNIRRQQVVTLQDDVIDELPPDVREELFRNINQGVWPTSKNIPIREVEDRLLALVQSNFYRASIRLVPRRVDDAFLEGLVRSSDPNDTFDILVGAEGRRSIVRSFCGGELTVPNRYMGEREYALGIAFSIPIRDDAALRNMQALNILLTMMQSRYLVNACQVSDTYGAKRYTGFLNVRLTREEYKGMKALMHSLPHGTNSNGTQFMNHQQTNRGNPWRRLVKDGLLLFSIDPAHVTRINMIKIDVQYAQHRMYNLYTICMNKYGRSYSGLAFLVGDAAMGVHFWPGRGLNSGIKSVQALSLCVAKLLANDAPLRINRFEDYDQFMSSLISKEQTLRSRIITQESISFAMVHTSLQTTNNYEQNIRDLSITFARMRTNMLELSKRRSWPLCEHVLPEERMVATLHSRLGRLSPITIDICATSGGWPLDDLRSEEINIRDYFKPKKEKTDPSSSSPENNSNSNSHNNNNTPSSSSPLLSRSASFPEMTKPNDASSGVHAHPNGLLASIFMQIPSSSPSPPSHYDAPLASAYVPPPPSAPPITLSPSSHSFSPSTRTSSPPSWGSSTTPPPPPTSTSTTSPSSSPHDYVFISGYDQSYIFDPITYQLHHVASDERNLHCSNAIIQLNKRIYRYGTNIDGIGCLMCTPVHDSLLLEGTPVWYPCLDAERDGLPYLQSHLVSGIATTSSYQKAFFLGGCAIKPQVKVSDLVLSCQYGRNEWTSLSPMCTPREHHAASSIDTDIFVTGGLDTHHNALSSVEIFKQERNSWVSVVPMQSARWHHASLVLDGCLYVIGGDSFHDAPPTPCVERYDPHANMWTQGPTPRDPSKYAASVVRTPNGRDLVYAFDEYQVERWDSREGEWHVLKRWDKGLQTGSATTITM